MRWSLIRSLAGCSLSSQLSAFALNPTGPTPPHNPSKHPPLPICFSFYHLSSINNTASSEEISELHIQEKKRLGYAMHLYFTVHILSHFTVHIPKLLSLYHTWNNLNQELPHFHNQGNHVPYSSYISHNPPTSFPRFDLIVLYTCFNMVESLWDYGNCMLVHLVQAI